MSKRLPQAAISALAFEETTLPNGLVIRVMNMPGHGSVHAMYSTYFGSINLAFALDGKEIQLPAGTAHFLEHKMFENEDGVDAFSLYAQTGAMANAYTSFDRTCYLFTATNDIDKNLDILLSFVSKPHFTQQTVQKEQGIIGQEIKMYEDVADFRLLFASLATMYHHHPIREDIAGTVETIAEITPELLYDCCKAFYTPANMVLCAAGNITMEQLLAAVERTGLPKEKAPMPHKLFPLEPEGIVNKKVELHMEVSMPSFSINFKEKPVEADDALLVEAMGDMLTELICGETSPLYRKLYDEGLVQPGFSGSYSQLDGCSYFMFSGEGPEPEKVEQLLKQEILRLRENGVDPVQFDICQKMMYGSAITDLSNVERVASMLTSTYFRGRTTQEELDAVIQLRVEDVNRALNTMLDFDKSTLCVIWPN